MPGNNNVAGSDGAGEVYATVPTLAADTEASPPALSPISTPLRTAKGSDSPPLPDATDLGWVGAQDLKALGLASRDEVVKSTCMVRGVSPVGGDCCGFPAITYSGRELQACSAENTTCDVVIQGPGVMRNVLPNESRPRLPRLTWIRPVHTLACWDELHHFPWHNSVQEDVSITLRMKAKAAAIECRWTNTSTTSHALLHVHGGQYP